MDYAGDTIAALATAPVPAALATIRVSGPNAVETCVHIAPRAGLRDWPGGVQRFVRLSHGGEHLDDAMVSVHRAPRSFTGENTVEFSFHGNPLIAGKILSALYANGCRAAEPGEFTRRAFLNGKMDLTQAEAVMDLIHAQSILALRAAGEQLAGRMGREIATISDDLLTVVAHLEAWIDFPEEDISPETGADLLARMERLEEQIAKLLDTEEEGRILRDGLRVVIAGPPNAGKSSLLNRLAGAERAIVSEVPGTTRDFIEEHLAIGGVPVRLVDTAGLRESQDPVERAGIARTRDQLGRADLVLDVRDGSCAPPKDGSIFPEHSPTAATRFLVLNKTDLGLHPGWMNVSRLQEAVYRVSCVTEVGLDVLATAVRHAAVQRGADGSEGFVAVNARHAAALRRAAAALAEGASGLREALAPDLVAVSLRAALDALGEIVGRMDAEDILSRIFSTFCIGK